MTGRDILLHPRRSRFYYFDPVPPLIPAQDWMHEALSVGVGTNPEHQLHVLHYGVKAALRGPAHLHQRLSP